jgi:hypothetical protein
LGTLPLVLLVLFFQHKIVQGLTAGAVKGWRLVRWKVEGWFVERLGLKAEG